MVHETLHCERLKTHALTDDKALYCVDLQLVLEAASPWIHQRCVPGRPAVRGSDPWVH